MKRSLSVALAVLLVLTALSACSGEPAAPDSSSPASDTPEPLPKPLVGVAESGILLSFTADVLETNKWCLGKDGLIVFASPYEISSYSEGVITFTVPHAKLSGTLMDKWLPVQ